MTAQQGPILRRADEHFDEIVVQTVVDLPLQMPGKLRMLEIARMDWQHVGMHGHGGVLEINQNLDGAVGLASRKRQQRMIVEAQVIQNLGKIWRVGHGNIVVEL